MNTASKYILGIAAMAIVALSSCKKDPVTPPPTNTYNVPKQYSFENVNYGGQTVRLLLLKDLMTAVGQSGVTKAQLEAIYNNTEARHADISTDKNLSGKIANSTINQQIINWFDSVEVLSSQSKPLVLSSGLDLKQAIEKTLMGAVFYNRALNDYLFPINGDDNNTVTAGSGTKMEHHWDEAFGYFGAARNFNDMNDAEIIAPGEKDANGDGKIDPTSEKNFFYAQTAAKRDAGSASFANGKTDYSKTLFDAFLKGRAAISNKDYVARDQAAKVVNENWEKIIAATVVHYINDTKSDLASSSADLNKHWSELYGYAHMLEYNTQAMISAENLDKVQSLIGDDIKNVTAVKLDEAAGIMKSTYGFTDEQISNW